MLAGAGVGLNDRVVRRVCRNSGGLRRADKECHHRVALSTTVLRPVNDKECELWRPVNDRVARQECHIRGSSCSVS
jgi:hypothetical protein